MSRESDRRYVMSRISHCEQRVMELRCTRANLDAETDAKILPLIDRAIELLEIAHDSYNFCMSQDRKNRGPSNT